ncbi:MAG: hypothetical protein HYY52_07545 [Candidatus Melainabacteria bacterium]|nr:hypothetical protein [Candidatus Melainabacteria bacterium]
MIKKEINWYFLDTGSNDGYFNMACDSYLLESLINGELKFPVLRVYRWSKPTISIGLNQSFSELNTSFYTIVKRISGGQAVYHGLCDDELTYSIVLNTSCGIKKIYLEIGEVLILFLKQYSLNAHFGYSSKNYTNDFNCFNTKTVADIVVNDIKIIGSAQCKKDKYILQHGSIRLDIIRDLSGKDVSFNTAAKNLKKCFEELLHVSFLDYKLLNKINV